MPWDVGEESCQRCLRRIDEDLEPGDWIGWKGWFRWRPKYDTWRKWHLSKDGETTACGYEIKQPELKLETRPSAPRKSSSCGRCDPSKGAKRRGDGSPWGKAYEIAELLFDLLVG